MNRTTLLMLSLVCLSGCGSSGGNSLAMFGPNTIPPHPRQPGTDPYYTASTASPANNAGATASTAPQGTLPLAPIPSTESTAAAPSATANSNAPATTATNPIATSTAAAPRPSGEPPIRIIEGTSVVPSTTQPESETSQQPSTGVPGTSPSPLLRSSTTPKLERIPSSAFGKKTSSSGVAQATYEQPISQAGSSTDSSWQQR